MSEEVEIPEEDKPFYLAVISVAITLINILIVGLGAFFQKKEMIESGLEMLKFTFPLTTMAWTFYFKASS